MLKFSHLLIALVWMLLLFSLHYTDGWQHGWVFNFLETCWLAVGWVLRLAASGRRSLHLISALMP